METELTGKPGAHEGDNVADGTGAASALVERDLWIDIGAKKSIESLGYVVGGRQSIFLTSA
ncbi:hypothetical protein DYQ94_05200 [Xanthomonas sp. LMG 8993]|uniref:hypothetical protein n=1 Tax=Xanthomonas TaxID=338 RepID=UPI001371CAE9|nr:MULTISPECIES: hypothetical protein [Xanthomonas]MBB4768929.1 hypothetical protein [Xanthomonas arboricola]MCC8474057.1 hypothetical protein [Xanthomonas arboricola]MXV46323.1 hypothetical protein [Xanthomonas sp. LMG 8993]